MRKIAFITGATSGIGQATARLFAANNIDLIICGRRQNKLDELAIELSDSVTVKTLAFDIGILDDVKSSIESLPDTWKSVDILVNSAGGAHGLDFMMDSIIDDWEKMIDYNVKGLLYVSRLLAPFMIQRKKGHIVNISSIAGKQTYQKGVVYCASKSAVESISDGMRLELVPHNIKVTNIAPGAVETEFSNVRFKGNTEKADSIYTNYKPLIAHDIADCIFFCVNAPNHVQIADMTVFPSAQSDATTIKKEL